MPLPRRRLTATLSFLAVFLIATPAQAHEKWFLDDPESYPTDWSFAATPLVLGLLALVVLATIVWRLVALRLPTPELGMLRPLGALAPYIPRLLGIHVGVTLLVLAASGRFLSWNLELASFPGGGAIALLEGALGIWFISGVHLRVPSLLLIIVGPLALLITGPVGLFSAADLLGIAAFLAVLPPSNAPYGRVLLEEKRTKLALLLLRLGVGTALVTLAFAEKLASPAMAIATLEAYPQLDVFSLVGLDVAPTVFVAIAGATELLFGLLVLSGAAPQAAVLVAAVPFNATLLIFGQVELIGHLPVYGVFLTLLVLGSHPTTAPWVRYLPSWKDVKSPRRLLPEPKVDTLQDA